MKKATMDDLETITQIEMNSGLKFPFERKENQMRKYFKRRLKSGEVFFLHKNLGYVSIIENYRDGSQVNFLSVKENQHRKGIGAKLMEKAENYIKSVLKKHKLYVYCWIYNNRALKFYLNRGYRIVDYKSERYSWGDPALILYKELK